jgi:hypothetical protein
MLGFTIITLELIIDENLPNFNKTKHRKKGEKGTRWMDPSAIKNKKSPTKQTTRGI